MPWEFIIESYSPHKMFRFLQGEEKTIAFTALIHIKCQKNTLNKSDRNIVLFLGKGKKITVRGGVVYREVRKKDENS